ncbi:MAG: type I 3-dehydroquinate dehydratase [Candidatus Aureabacteria bacterium]|nr:type I 3-dehydroquinate dehydratase [Candidatus Auribacterota bacterium]
MNYFTRIILVTDEFISDSTLKSLSSRGVSLIELRVDQCRRHDKEYLAFHAQRIQQFSCLPLLITIRSRKEGGKNLISGEKRLELFQSLIPQVQFVDVELSSTDMINQVVSFARQHGVKTIVSFHDFKQTPPDQRLENIFHLAKQKKADIIKLAVHAESLKDVQRLLVFTLKHRTQSVITISMGRIGALSRLLFPLAGSLFTYTSLKESLAPGQIPLQNFTRLLYELDLNGRMHSK